MNSLKRLFITLKTQLDYVADEVENHQALAEVAIKDLEAHRRKARIHQHRLQGMVEQFESQLGELHKEVETWSARAVKTKQQDEQRALQCVKCMLQTQQRIKLIEPQLKASQQQYRQLQEDLLAIDAQLRALHTQKEVLSARQNRVQLQAATMSNANPTQEALTIFKRWEESVVGWEFTSLEKDSKDSFTESFEQEENELALKALLTELVSKQTEE